MTEFLKLTEPMNCPFCGEDTYVYRTIGHEGWTEYQIKCDECKATGPRVYNERLAIASWNGMVSSIMDKYGEEMKSSYNNDSPPYNPFFNPICPRCGSIESALFVTIPTRYKVCGCEYKKSVSKEPREEESTKL